MGTKANPGDFDCYANAKDDEPMFVLLARDKRAPALVRLWADLRAQDVELPVYGPQTPEGAQIEEAEACALDMERWRRENRR